MTFMLNYDIDQATSISRYVLLLMLSFAIYTACAVFYAFICITNKYRYFVVTNYYCRHPYLHFYTSDTVKIKRSCYNFQYYRVKLQASVICHITVIFSYS